MKNSDFQFMKKITEAFGPSGMEDGIRNLLLQELSKLDVSLKVDRIGNLIAVKGNGGNVLLSAHMDEVGFMVKGIQDDGTLLFSPIGGMNPENLPSKKIFFEQNGILGVIGSKPIHLKKKDSDKITYRDLYIDIGATTADEAKKLIEIGDCAVFFTETKRLKTKHNAFCGKSFDDRLGCVLLCDLIRSDKIQNATFAFTVGEEIGLSGATALAQNSEFEYGFAIDVTTPNDLPEVVGPNRVCALGKGPVISLADGRTVYQKQLIRKIFQLLDQNKIPYQTKSRRAGGNEASAFQKEGAGMSAVSLSIPCRYIHGPVGILHEKDYIQSRKAMECILTHIQSGEF